MSFVYNFCQFLLLSTVVFLLIAFSPTFIDVDPQPSRYTCPRNSAMVLLSTGHRPTINESPLGSLFSFSLFTLFLFSSSSHPFLFGALAHIYLRKINRKRKTRKSIKFFCLPEEQQHIYCFFTHILFFNTNQIR